MIAATRWRRATLAAIVGADVLLLLLVAGDLPGFLPFLLPVLAGATLWALGRPGGWGAFALVLVQAVGLGVGRGAPETVADWAAAALGAVAVLLTHLACSLRATWPPGASLPRATALRWARQAVGLALTAVAGAVVAASVTATPWQWAPWSLAGGLVLLAVVGATFWAGAGRRRA